MTNKIDAIEDHDSVGEEARVTTLELFFDLVFVFIVTQLTVLLSETLSWESLLQAFLIFIVLFWMYGGYAWLTNSVPPVTPGRKLLLIAGMAGFLICALALPGAYHGTGVIFGVGYLLVILVHGAMYVRAVGWEAARFVPLNFLSAFVVIGAGSAEGTIQYLLWILAIGFHILASYLGTGLGFGLRVSHFVERHGLLLLIALGESILAIGASYPTLDLRFIFAAVMGLILSAALWWLYFARDDAVAHANMLARSGAAQLRQALGAYFYAFIPMLFGIILLAAGMEASIEHLTERLDPAHAFVFGGGVGLYLIGTVLFRRASAIPGVIYRYIAAGLAVITSFLGSTLYAGLQFAGLILILVGLIVAESHRVRLK